MRSKKIIPLILVIPLLIQAVFQAPVFADQVNYADTKTSYIDWSLGEREIDSTSTNVDGTGGATVTKTYKDSLKTIGQGKISFSVATDSDGKIIDSSVLMSGDVSIFDNTSGPAQQELVEPTVNGSINGVTSYSCPSGTKRVDPVGAGGKPQCFKEMDTSSHYYAVDENGGITIRLNTEQFGNPLICNIASAKGKTLSEFNSSVKSCAEKMDRYEDGDKQFGTITYKSTDGEPTELNPDGLTNEAQGYDPYSASEGLSDGSSDGSNEACYDNAGGLAWIICPVIQMAADFSQWFYGSIIEPQLQIQASGIFETDGGVYQAWSGFRDIANVVFVILFLVIIISQLTGYGIDNYGIKRMLPRLIIAAILINLSYFICQIAVDVANIIGVSISNFLSGFVESQELKGSSPDGGQYLFTFAAGAAVSAGVVMIGGLGAVISILITAVSVLISLMVLLAILTARQAAVIILIVISPIALVCYLLPNTEGLTKKWLKIAETMLLLYPICSLVIAAGSLAGNVIASAAGDNTGMYIAAMLVQVIPYLAIPSLVKNSMAGLGNLGARISNLGQRASRGATTALNKSEAMKGIRTSLNAVGTKENGFRSKILGKTAMGRRRLGKQNLEAAQRRQAKDKAERMGRPGWRKMIDKNLADENRKESAKILQSTYEGMSDQSLQNEFASALTDKGAFEDGRIDALVNTYMDKGDYDGLYDALKNAETSGASHSAMKRAADAMKANRNFGELSAKRTSLGEWAKSDQVLDNGNGVSVAMYNNMGSFKPKDWASMNGAERDLAFDKLEDMKNDPYYAEDYKAAAKSMREAINNENLRGNMAPETIKKYKDFSDNVLGPESQQPVTPQAPVLRLGDMSTAEYTASSAEQRKALREGEGTTSVGWQELSRMATEYKDNPQLAATASGNAQREMAFYNDLNDKIKDKNSFETISDDDLEHLVSYAASNSVAGLEHIRRVASDAVNDSEIVSNLQSRGPTKAGGLSGADRLDAMRTLANGRLSRNNATATSTSTPATNTAQEGQSFNVSSDHQPQQQSPQQSTSTSTADNSRSANNAPTPTPAPTQSQPQQTQPSQTIELQNVPRTSDAKNTQDARNIANQQLNAVRAANGMETRSRARHAAKGRTSTANETITRMRSGR